MAKKSGKRDHCHRWGLRHGHRVGAINSSSSDSSSDSDVGRHKNKKTKKSLKKSLKKQWKHLHKFGHFGQQSDPMANRVVCTLCRHQIQPMVETEVLECGHIYHRLCLKGLFELALNANNDQLNVMCTQCEHHINQNLINEFKVRFNGQPIGASQQVMDLQII